MSLGVIVFTHMYMHMYMYMHVALVQTRGVHPSHLHSLPHQATPLLRDVLRTCLHYEVLYEVSRDSPRSRRITNSVGMVAKTKQPQVNVYEVHQMII